MSDTKQKNVTILVEDIFAKDNFGKYVDDGGSSAVSNDIWTDYIIKNRYEKDKHIYMMGVASPDGFSTGSSSKKNTVSFVQLASQTQLLIVDWTCERANKKPTIPNPNIQDEDWVLMDEHIEPDMVDLDPDGITYIWRISGSYFYGCKNPGSNATQKTFFPKPPWLKEDATARTLTTDMLDSTLIKPEGV